SWGKTSRPRATRSTPLTPRCERYVPRGHARRAARCSSLAATSAPARRATRHAWIRLPAPLPRDPEIVGAFVAEHARHLAVAQRVEKVHGFAGDIHDPGDEPYPLDVVDELVVVDQAERLDGRALGGKPTVEWRAPGL